MSSAPMIQETITPCVVAVCGAVNRSRVSSSSSASIFEVLRDSHILGSDGMKKSPRERGLESKAVHVKCANICFF